MKASHWGIVFLLAYILFFFVMTTVGLILGTLVLGAFIAMMFILVVGVIILIGIIKHVKDEEEAKQKLDDRLAVRRIIEEERNRNKE